MLDDVEVTASAQRVEACELVEREVAVVATLARDIAPAGQDAVDTHTLGNVLEGVPGVVLVVARRIDVVPQGEERRTVQRHAGATCSDHEMFT